MSNRPMREFLVEFPQEAGVVDRCFSTLPEAKAYAEKWLGLHPVIYIQEPIFKVDGGKLMSLVSAAPPKPEPTLGDILGEALREVPYNCTTHQRKTQPGKPVARSCSLCGIGPCKYYDKGGARR